MRTRLKKGFFNRLIGHQRYAGDMIGVWLCGRKGLQTGIFGRLLAVLMLPLAGSSTAFCADLNVLIVGSTGDSTLTTSATGTSGAFDPTAVRTYLQNILQGAGVGSVNVVVENRGSPYGLAAWFHYPYTGGCGNHDPLA